MTIICDIFSFTCHLSSKGNVTSIKNFITAIIKPVSPTIVQTTDETEVRPSCRNNSILSGNEENRGNPDIVNKASKIPAVAKGYLRITPRMPIRVKSTPELAKIDRE